MYLTFEGALGLSLEKRHCFPSEAPLNHNVGECSMFRNCSTISKYTIAIVHYLRRFDSTNPKGLVELRLHMAPAQSEASSDTARPTPHDGADLAQVRRSIHCCRQNPPPVTNAHFSCWNRPSRIWQRNTLLQLHGRRHQVSSLFELMYLFVLGQNRQRQQWSTNSLR